MRKSEVKCDKIGSDNQGIDSLYKKLKTSPERGIDSKTAKDRRRAFGSNELKETEV